LKKKTVGQADESERSKFKSPILQEARAHGSKILYVNEKLKKKGTVDRRELGARELKSFLPTTTKASGDDSFEGPAENGTSFVRARMYLFYPRRFRGLNRGCRETEEDPKS